MQLPRVMGHRGAAAHAPENTLASLRAAAALGAPWVEFDVMVTRDDVPVLYHDDHLKRMTGAPGLMAETDYADLAKLRVKGKKGADEPILSLEAALRALLDLGLHPNIELKPTAGRDVATALAATAVAVRVWPADRPPPLVSSFSRLCLAVAAARLPGWPRGLLAVTRPKDWRAALADLDCRTVHLAQRYLTRRQVVEIKAAGYQLAAYTVNDAKRARRLAAWSVDCLISDAPGRIAAALGPA